MTNLALKYRPKSFEDVVEQSDVVKILESMCEQPELHNRNFLLVGPRGCGKANPMYTNILTPSGFKKMGDIEIGDKVFTHSGRVAIVSGVYPQGVRPIYRISLADKTYIDVSDEHLNMITVSDRTSSKTTCEDKIIKTINLFEAYKNSDAFKDFTICVKTPRVDFDKCDVLCPPYTFGALIRNGGFDDAGIPEEYLFNTFYYRIDLLKALLYTDYEDNKSLASSNILKGKMTLFCSGKALSSSISFLVRSLGIVDTVYDYSHYMSNFDIDADIIRGCQFEFAHVLHIPKDIVSLIFEPDKILDEDNYSLLREITSVEYIGEEDCQCIMVDDPDHSYICDEGFIPTHNTTLGRIMASKLNNGLGSPIELDAASNSGVDTVRNIISQAREYPIGTKYKVFICDECHAFSQAAWSSLLKTLEEQPARSVFILLTTNPEKIPQTILSRVQKFRLSTISLDGIVSRLKYVIEQENKEGRNITYEDEALTYIAKLAKGGMRDSLTLLDKALVYSNDITSSNIKVSLGIPDYQDYFDLLNAYAKKDNLKTIEVVQKVYNSGTNFVKWFEEFQSFVINIVKYVYLQDISETMIPPYYKDKISHYGPKHVQLCLHLSQVLVELISKISRTEYMEEVAISYLMRK